MFPFPCILQHYVEFNIHTIAMLEKLLGVGSFSDYIDHLIRHHAILFTFLSGLNLPYVVQIVTFAFWGCCALITLALVTHFQ
jgi:hypothetical protein